MKILRNYCLILFLFSYCTTHLFAESDDERTRTLSVLSGKYVQAIVPREQAEKLRPIVHFAENTLAQMYADAGTINQEPLWLLLSDSRDSHNGFSTTVPHPLVQMDLAPALPHHSIFSGHEGWKRTLIHECAHHISNNTSYGARSVLGRIFGRVLPFDLASLGLFYLTTPSHVTMPRFWHEGIGQWAETIYSPEDSLWNGRGRDSLTHMIWRLDAAAGTIPPTNEWSITFHEWPYGSSAYYYGAAYLRFLSQRFPEQSLWKTIDDQAHQWAFKFSHGSRHSLGASHTTLLEDARAALLTEQQQHLSMLRTEPITETTRLTPAGWRLGMPCWDGSRIHCAAHDPYKRPRFITVDTQGHIEYGALPAFGLGAIRSANTLRIWSQRGNDQRSSLIVQDGQATPQQIGERFLQGDIRKDNNGYTLAAIHLLPAAQQELLIQKGATLSHLQTAAIIPCTGMPWSPSFRPQHNQILWVETTQAGSHLQLTTLNDTTQTKTLLTLPGRIIHPCWNKSGDRIYFSADHSGVANGWKYDLTTNSLSAVTNTVGGIIACVPSPDERTLAVIEHDHTGPFLAIIPVPKTTITPPHISLSWPKHDRAYAQNLIKKCAQPQTQLTKENYTSITRIRPQFWTPTMLTTPDGGLGILGQFADPIHVNTITGSVGIGAVTDETIGMLHYTYAGLPIEISGLAMHSNRLYGSAIADINGNSYDYVDEINRGELRLSYTTTGQEYRLSSAVTFGLADYTGNDTIAKEYAQVTTINNNFYTGTESYLEAEFTWSNFTTFPRSYTRENGSSTRLRYRRSEFSDIGASAASGDRLELHAEHTFSLFPEWGHQLHLSGTAGWSNQPTTGQSAFRLGGAWGQQFPRGYETIMASGRTLLGWSATYRFPVWQPFIRKGTSPFSLRQLVTSLFYDEATVSPEEFHKETTTIRSVGGGFHANIEFAGIIFNPGLYIAQQLDGNEDVYTFITLDFIQ